MAESFAAHGPSKQEKRLLYCHLTTSETGYRLPKQRDPCKIKLPPPIDSTT